jgi:hypothetical protein
MTFRIMEKLKIIENMTFCVINNQNYVKSLIIELILNTQRQ